MSKTYQAVAINLRSYVYRNGVKVCDGVADCGHNHESIVTSTNCLDTQQSRGSLLWQNAEVRDSSGMPVPEEEVWEAMVEQMHPGLSRGDK